MKVNSPGKINIVDPSMNIIDAIGMVDGFTSIANRKKIKVIRFDGEKPEVYSIDLTDT